ncbi:hypothetical protein [Pseudorhodobacter ferrugineus]|uniref:hypothetical protein n=1 Tax=Pseudorhodobacter ferrugineus TaxID=77008 RepID=UPI000526D5BD|nr:hypothetical protein [Pseudorhodobacter ferrugineus]
MPEIQPVFRNAMTQCKKVKPTFDENIMFQSGQRQIKNASIRYENQCLGRNMLVVTVQIARL